MASARTSIFGISSSFLLCDILCSSCFSSFDLRLMRLRLTRHSISRPGRRYSAPSRITGWGSVLCNIEVVIGGVRHQHLAADVGGDGTAGGGCTSAGRVQPLDVGGFRQYAEWVRRTVLGPNYLQQKTGNRTRIGATGVATGCEAVELVAPDDAAVERALPRGAAKWERGWGKLIGVRVGAEEVGKDLLAEGAEQGDKQGGLRPRGIDRPRGASARRQADIALGAGGVPQEERRVPRRRRKDGGCGGRRDPAEGQCRRRHRSCQQCKGQRCHAGPGDVRESKDSLRLQSFAVHVHSPD